MSIVRFDLVVLPLACGKVFCHANRRSTIACHPLDSRGRCQGVADVYAAFQVKRMTAYVPRTILLLYLAKRGVLGIVHIIRHGVSLRTVHRCADIYVSERRLQLSNQLIFKLGTDLPNTSHGEQYTRLKACHSAALMHSTLASRQRRHIESQAG